MMLLLKVKLNQSVYEVLDYHDDKTFPNLMDVVNHFNEGKKKIQKGRF